MDWYFLRSSNTGNIFAQLVMHIVALQVKKHCSPYYHLRSQLVMQQISMLQVAVHLVNPAL